MGKRRKILLIALPLAIVAILGVLLFGQTPQAVPGPATLQPTATTPSTETPETSPTTPSTETSPTTPSNETPETTQPTPSNETPEDLPPNLLVVPEVPLGSLAIVLACFFALLIAQRRPKNPLSPKI
jgi:cytoskeletal protein RodZ